MEALSTAIGALAVLAATWLQGRLQAQRDDRAAAERAADRAAEAGRKRAQEAALACDRLFTSLASLMPNYLAALRSAKVTEEAEKRLRDRVRSTFDEIEHWMVDLPSDPQARVDRALKIIREADRMGTGSASDARHYHSPTNIARNATRYVHSVLTAFLRNEPAPPPSEWIVEYEATLVLLLEELEWVYAQEIGEDVNEREEWLAAHPTVRAELKRYGFDPPGTD